MSSAPPRTVVDLPTELIEMIGMKLIEDSPHNDSVVPVIPRLLMQSRQAVYSSRLVCRVFNNALQKVFLEIIHGMPFQCTKEDLRRLTRLLKLPWVSQSFKQLTIGGYKIAKRSIQHDRITWILQHLMSTFMTILRLAPRLESIRCVPIFEYYALHDPRGADEHDSDDDETPRQLPSYIRSFPFIDVFGVG